MPKIMLQVLVLMVVAVLLLIKQDLIVSSAQESGVWSDNYQLIKESDSQGSLPRVVVDRQGRVHVFWVTGTEDSNQDFASNNPPAVIMYTRQDVDGWTKANDVLSTIPLGPLILGSVAIDDRDYLNLLWFDQGNSRKLVLSQAHTSEAENTQNWSTQVLETPQYAMGFPDLAIGDNGRIHVVYPLDNSSVIYITSYDYGETWSSPLTIWSVQSTKQEAVSYPRIAVDDKGYLHMVWANSVRERNWLGDTAFYARSIDDGATWNVLEIQRSLPGEPTVGWINVVVRDGNEIHLAWNRGIGSSLGRYHTWSDDNGETWQEAQPFLPNFVSGQTQWPLMVVDADQTLHLITVAGGPPSVGEGDDEARPRYAFWRDNHWSEMYTFPESTADYDTAFAIGLGNQLHIVHANRRFEGYLLYNTMFTGAVPVPKEHIAAPIRLIPTVIPVVQNTVTSNTQDSLLQADLQNYQFDRSPVETSDSDNPFMPIFASIMISLMLVMPTLIHKFWSHR